MRSIRRSSWSCLLILATATVLAGPAVAVDLATNAVVEIVEGIAVNQTTALNFGTLARNSGSVTVAPADGGITDPNSLVVDATDLSQGVFSVASQTGANLVVDCTAGSMPAGITLGTFMADWADLGAPGAVPLNRSLAADTEALEIGATISVDRSTVAVSGAPVNLPYTVSVTFQ